MPPTAVTPAARSKRPASSAGKAAPSPTSPSGRAAPTRPTRPSSPHPSTPRGGHRTPVARTAAPSRPRRASGPARSARAAELRAAEVDGAQARVTRTPARPATRRQPQPSRQPPSRQQAPRRRQAASERQPAAPFSVRSLAFVRALPDHSLLDRIVRGRIWIPLLGVLLVGIVAMQVEVLKLNAGIGRSTVQAATLQTENQHLRTSDAQLSSEQTIESEAARMGMTMAAPTGVRFVANGTPQAATRAATSVHAPDATAFSQALEQRAVAAEQAAADAGATQADSTDG